MGKLQLNYVINDLPELNLSYMPFINEGGLFIPTNEDYSLGDRMKVELQLPGVKKSIMIDGKIVWITPKNALYHVLPGVGIQFVGADASEIRNQIEAHLDHSVDVGGYTYGMMEETKKIKKIM